MHEPAATRCHNCGSAEVQVYCSNCGQKHYKSRLDWNIFFEELNLATVHLSSRLLVTLKRMLLDPGRLVNDYFNGMRKSVQGPITYLLLGFIFYQIAVLISKPYGLETGTFGNGSMDRAAMAITIAGALVIGYLAATRGRLTFVETAVFYCYMNGTSLFLLPLFVGIQLWGPIHFAVSNIGTEFRFLIVDLPFYCLEVNTAIRSASARRIPKSRLFLAAVLTFCYAMLIGYDFSGPHLIKKFLLSGH